MGPGGFATPDCPTCHGSGRSDIPILGTSFPRASEPVFEWCPRCFPPAQPAVRPQTVRSIGLADDPAATMRDAPTLYTRDADLPGPLLDWVAKIRAVSYAHGQTILDEIERRARAYSPKGVVENCLFAAGEDLYKAACAGEWPSLVDRLEATKIEDSPHFRDLMATWTEGIPLGQSTRPQWKPTALPDPGETVRWKLDDGTRYVSFAGALFEQKQSPPCSRRLWPLEQAGENLCSLDVSHAWFDRTWEIGQDMKPPLVLVARTGENVVLRSNGVLRWVGNETDGSGVIVDEAGILVRQADRVVYFEPPKSPLAAVSQAYTPVPMQPPSANVQQLRWEPSRVHERDEPGVLPEGGGWAPLAGLRPATPADFAAPTDDFLRQIAPMEPPSANIHFVDCEGDPADDPLLVRIVPPHEWEHIETARTILEAAGGSLRIEVEEGWICEKRPDGSWLISVDAWVEFEGPNGGVYTSLFPAMREDNDRFHFITKDEIADAVTNCLGGEKDE